MINALGYAILEKNPKQNNFKIKKYLKRVYVTVLCLTAFALVIV
mgnify:CR=1 FL=1|jgi:hypothetical protein